MFQKSFSPVFPILASLILFLPSSLAQILSSIDFKFREEQVQGSYVGNVAVSSRLATTLSENEFSRLKFNLPDSKYFKIDEKSGSLISAVKIDREDVCEGQDACKLTNEIIVYTRIGAGNYDILKVITMNVEILDINDNSPEFPSRVVGLTIPESNDRDHTLRTRGAVDKDTGDNSVKEYRFQDLTNTFLMSIHKNPDGSSYLGIVVKEKEKLDREVRDFYQVTIVATDGGFPQRSGSVVINITVADVNDNSPEFSQASYNGTMQENMVLKVPILKVKAIDADSGKNAEISYQFSSRVSNRFRQKFYIDGRTGEIFAQSNIDYEEDKLFQFIVEAVDHGTPQITSRTNVNLHVIDMNDNSPQILINLPPTGTEVSENEPVGKFIAHLTIIDLDSGNNGAVVCTMDDENFSLEKFIDHSSNRYKVVLAKSLDYEQNTYHRVSVACSDGGVPQLSNSTTFIVSVLDVNDNRPSFTESTYTQTVLENQEGDEEILEVTAHDWDSGEFGRVSYIIEEKFADVFSIHQATGVIRVLRMLDREDVSRYEFYVIAQDNGPERLSSSALVVIIVDDENDEPPRFLNPVYFGNVLENQPAGTSVGVAIAVDNDSPANAQMVYSILDLGDDYIHFSMDPKTGVIISETMFDREKKENYYLVIKVADPNKSSFFGICNFTIRVLDENDHAPVIRMSSEDNSTYFIPYSAPVGSIITNIFAYDDDETSSQHSKLRFFVDKGDPEQLFEMNTYTGSLTLARAITTRDFKTYNLVIVVDDGGTPPRFDTKHLSIKINGTIPDLRESAISENIIIAIIIVCVTVTLAFVIVITILLIRKFDRQRRSNRANQKVSEENMYQLNRQELFNDLGSARSDDSNLNKRSKKETKVLSSSIPMLDGSPEDRADLNKQSHLRSPPRDEECRLIEILQKNDGEAGTDSSEDTDPSDSGRGGSEDETSHRGCGIDHEHPGKLHHSNYHRGLPPSSDSKHKHQPYHQQKLLPAKSTSKSSLYSTKGKPSMQPGPSKRSSYTSDVDSEVSGIRGSQSRLDNERATSVGNQSYPSSRSIDNSGRSSNQSLPFQSRERTSSQKLTKDSANRLGASSDTIHAPIQTFHGSSSGRLQSAPSVVNHSKGRQLYPASNKSYATPSRQYKYTDRAYPLSERLGSPTSLPEDDDRTTTSGSYTVNPEELRDDLHTLVLHDTVV